VEVSVFCAHATRSPMMADMEMLAILVCSAFFAKSDAMFPVFTKLGETSSIFSPSGIENEIVEMRVFFLTPRWGYLRI